MAPLPFNNTAIGFVDYTGNSGEHTALIRVFANADRPTVEAIAGAYGNLLAACLTADALVQGIRTQLANTNFSLPGPFTPVPGAGSTNLAETDAPRFFSIVGRTTGGRRVRYFVYNSFVAPGDDYRVDNPGTTPLIDLITFLNTNEFICGIDNLPQSVNNYLNVGYNAYFQRKQRRIN